MTKAEDSENREAAELVAALEEFITELVEFMTDRENQSGIGTPVARERLVGILTERMKRK